MNFWLACDKWQHLLGSACIFNLIYLFLYHHTSYGTRLKLHLWGLKEKHVALILALLCAVGWEIGQASIWPLDWPDTAWDLVADCAGIFTMWRLAK